MVFALHLERTITLRGREDASIVPSLNAIQTQQLTEVHSRSVQACRVRAANKDANLGVHTDAFSQLQRVLNSHGQM